MAASASAQNPDQDRELSDLLDSIELDQVVAVPSLLRRVHQQADEAGREQLRNALSDYLADSEEAFQLQALHRKRAFQFLAELDPDQQLEYLERAARAAAVAYPPEDPNSQDVPAYIEWRIAKQLRAEGQFSKAALALETALERYPEAHRQKAALIQLLADLRRLRGNHEDALELNRQALELAPAGPRGDAIRAWAPGIESMTLLEMGRPDLAYRAVLAGLRNAESLPPESNIAGSVLRSARMYHVAYLNAISASEAVVATADEYLADTDLYASAPADTAVMLDHKANAQIDLVRAGQLAPEVPLTTLKQILAMEALPEAVRINAVLELASLECYLGEQDRARATLDEAARSEMFRAYRENPSFSIPLTYVGRWLSIRTQLELRSEFDESRFADLLAELEEGFNQLLAAWDHAPRLESGIGFVSIEHPARRQLLSAVLEAKMRVSPGQPGIIEAIECLHRSTKPRIACAGSKSSSGGPCRVSTNPSSWTRGLAVCRRRTSFLRLLPWIASTPLAFGSAPDARLEVLRRNYWEAHQALLADSEDEQKVAEERQCAKSLAHQLLPTAIEELLQSWNKLSIVGVEGLGPVPFDLLPSSLGSHLGWEIDLDYLPSIPVGMALVRDFQTRSDALLDLLLVGGVHEKPSPLIGAKPLAALPLSEQIRQSLTQPYRDGRSLVLQGPNASFSTIQKTPPALVSQYLVHGVQLAEEQRAFALAVTPDTSHDGWLRSRDIEQHLVGSPLTILTACGSGLGRTVRGDAYSATMARSWLAKGSHAVLTTCDELRYSDAVDLSRALHQALAAGASPAAALRQARIQMDVQNDPRVRIHMGGLQVLGLGHAPHF